MVAVDYTDLLAITLPYNLHHFEEVWIITDQKCEEAVREVCWKIEGSTTPISILATDHFYRDGATFNKWRALEWGLDIVGRYGWLCLMDADVLWPKDIEFYKTGHEPILGYLYSPLRRIWTNYPALHRNVEGMNLNGLIVPAENEWRKFPIHRNTAEWAGYSQIFHAQDPVLGSPPWHETNWKHAGGADSFFQAKWRPENKIRPPFEVLHLGEAGKNWYGRQTEENREEKQRQINAIWEGRRARRSQGLEPFGPEKIS